MRCLISPFWFSQKIKIPLCLAFITGLIRLWLMDGGASVLRPHADDLIAAHIAMLRREPKA